VLQTPSAGKRDAEAWMGSMGLHGERAAAAGKAEGGGGQVAAAKEAAAAGTASASAQKEGPQPAVTSASR
jgi:hypothetical protein